SFLDGRGMLTPAAAAYFEEIERFIVCRKKDIHLRNEREEHGFRYDFRRIEAEAFRIDPRQADRYAAPSRMAFFHDPDPVKHIRKSHELHKHHPGGRGRMTQPSTLKLMYRQVKQPCRGVTRPGFPSRLAGALFIPADAV